MSFTADDEGKSWKMIWKINASGKMKIHIWRFAQDCIPTGTQMQHHHILVSDACVFCGREEDVEHALLQCQFAKEVCRQVKHMLNFNLAWHDFMSPKS
jgi:hypothetical protein